MCVKCGTRKEVCVRYGVWEEVYCETWGVGGGVWGVARSV